MKHFIFKMTIGVIMASFLGSWFNIDVGLNFKHYMLCLLTWSLVSISYDAIKGLFK